MNENGMENRVLEALRREGRPLAPETVFEAFEAEERDAVASAVEQLLGESRLILTRKRKLALPEQTGLIYGRIQGNARGYGFFIPEDGSPDLFIPADAMHGAMHGDKVWVRQADTVSRNGNAEAEVMLIAIRAQANIVGTFEQGQGAPGGYVIPDDSRIYSDLLVYEAASGGAKHGDKVVAKITQYPDGRRPLMGEVIEVLGGKDEAGTDILSVIRRMDLPEAFTKASLRQARTLNKPVDADAIARREDLRGQCIITIDGADAKDLDDAVSLKKLKDGWLLGVHIADVSYYVHPGTALDADAYKRGTSVYFPDRVLPMFPPEVSNGVCSLNEGTEKLTLSCFMEIGKNGKVLAHRFSETVIRTAHRMTYDAVNAIFDGDAALREKYADVVPMLEEMRALMQLLNAQRVKRGSLDFDLDEAKITLNAAGKPTEVSVATRGPANRMIEEFMLIANETVAEHAFSMGFPLIYRVHETPDKTKLADLNAFLNTLGYGMKNVGNVKAQTFQRILQKAKGTKEENVVNRVVLRTMKKARYAPECLGHFGLAAPCYCHFTSPIRRYPDLMVHRILREILRGEMTKERIEAYGEKLAEIAQHCSEREVAAMEAERAADDLKKCEYMQTRIGTVETGIISGVAQYGFFVQLSNTVEGMVRVSSIAGDFYVCDMKNYRMVGRNSKRVFRLGDPVRVRVASVDLENSNVDFELVSSANGGEAKLQNGHKGKEVQHKSKAGAKRKQMEEPPSGKEEKPQAAKQKQGASRRRRSRNPAGKVAKDAGK